MTLLIAGSGGFHLAGVNRPDRPEGFEENHTFTATLLEALERHQNGAPVLYACASSTG